MRCGLPQDFWALGDMSSILIFFLRISERNSVTKLQGNSTSWGEMKRSSVRDFLSGSEDDEPVVTSKKGTKSNDTVSRKGSRASISQTSTSTRKKGEFSQHGKRSSRLLLAYLLC